MGQTTTARRGGQYKSGRDRAAAARAAAATRERRRRLLTVLGSAVAVLAVIGVIVAVGVTSSGKTADTARAPASAAVVAAVTGVPAATLDAVGTGTVAAGPKAVTDTPLTAAGKPEVLFIGAEFCPFCAAERWAIVQSLSRFGTFTGLSTVHSSPTDVYPNTATFTFYGAGYNSALVSFTSREVETVTGSQLQSPTPSETALWNKYTGQGTFPFLDIGGRYVITAPSFDPAVLKGLTASAIAQQLANPTSNVAKAVDGTSNVITAAICETTGNKPTAVCSAAGVVAAAKTLNG
jgi:hypothetical protein